MPHEPSDEERWEIREHMIAARKRANYEDAKRHLRKLRNERMAEVRRWYEAALANTRAAHGIDEDE